MAPGVPESRNRIIMENSGSEEDMNSKALSLALALAAPALLSHGKDLEVSKLSPERHSLGAIGLGDFPLEGRVESLLASKAPEGWTATGKDRNFYLELMEPILSNAVKWVDKNGAVIDPVIDKEWNQATPRFVSSAAILLKYGRMPELREPAFRAMSRCCSRLKLPETKGSSPDFWMRELVTAYLCFDGIAPKELMEQWRRDLSAVEPEAVYKEVDPTHKKLKSFHNWCVYSGSGESMRQSAGIGASRDFLWGDKFFELYMEAQTGHFTAFGMYRDPNDPIT